MGFNSGFKGLSKSGLLTLRTDVPVVFCQITNVKYE